MPNVENRVEEMENRELIEAAVGGVGGGAVGGAEQN